MMAWHWALRTDDLWADPRAETTVLHLANLRGQCSAHGTAATRAVHLERKMVHH